MVLENCIKNTRITWKIILRSALSNLGKMKGDSVGVYSLQVHVMHRTQAERAFEKDGGTIS